MWICIVSSTERFLQHRLCLVVFVALAVISLSEAPRAKAQDILKGVNQARNLELYYAAVTTVIPTAVTSVLAEHFESPQDEEEENGRAKSDDASNAGRPEKSNNLANSIANATVAPAMNGHRKVNDRNNLKKAVERSGVYSKDEVESNKERIKDRTNTHDHDERTTNKSRGQLTALGANVIEYDVADDGNVVTHRTLPFQLQDSVISGDPDFVNTENNDIYEFYDEEENDYDADDEEEVIGPIVERTRKDTTDIEGVTWQSLQRLAEFATASNPDLSLINLVTPNPDIEITIEVLPGIGTDDDEIYSANEVTQTKSPKRKGKGKKGRGKKKKDKGRTNKDSEDGERISPNIPSRHGAESKEEETNKPINNGGKAEDESSYFYPHIPVFEDLNFFDVPPIEEGGEWTDWSRCSASCGGGRTERSRSCGFSCTSTETQDCNQQSCPEIEYLGSQIIAGIQPALETSSPTIQTTDELFRYLDPSLPEFETDSCAEWMSCKSEQLMSLLSRLEDLPSCPCHYPTLRVNDLIWDKLQRKVFRWIVSDSKKEDLDVYKPSAKYCIRSLLSAHSTSLAAQQCCYDEKMRLITRGPGAGTPKLISREISPELNYKIDILPWIICKGDWSKYNTIRHPNNARGCRQFPGDEAYQLHLEELMDF
ncbi:isthmin-like isoform X2 [Amphiura filiformis]|uniref:isthmin-like isoform X2 n=1 Tax=Amphiura filiformis TaxID=82378 RepID=UPI003B214B16